MIHKRLAGVVTLLVVSTAMFAQTGNNSKRPAAKPSAPKAAPVASANPQPANVLPTQETAQAFLDRMFGYNENIKLSVASIRPTEVVGVSEIFAIVNTPQGQQSLRFYVLPDGKHAIIGDMGPFGADPYADQRAMLAAESFGPFKGPKDAKVVAVEFADLQCPACKVAQPVMEKLQTDFPQVRFVFQNFPLEKLHPWAAQASRYLDCIQRTSNEGAWTFLQAVFSHQSEITEANVAEKLNKYAGMAGVQPEKVAACVSSPETEARLQRSIELGKRTGLTGTPSLFVNGRPIPTVSLEDYQSTKALVQFEIDQAKAAR